MYFEYGVQHVAERVRGTQDDLYGFKGEDRRIAIRGIYYQTVFPAMIVDGEWLFLQLL